MKIRLVLPFVLLLTAACSTPQQKGIVAYSLGGPLIVGGAGGLIGAAAIGEGGDAGPVVGAALGSLALGAALFVLGDVLYNQEPAEDEKVKPRSPMDPKPPKKRSDKIKKRPKFVPRQ